MMIDLVLWMVAVKQSFESRGGCSFGKIARPTPALTGGDSTWTCPDFRICQQQDGQTHRTFACSLRYFNAVTKSSRSFHRSEAMRNN